MVIQVTAAGENRCEPAPVTVDVCQWNLRRTAEHGASHRLQRCGM